MKEPDEVNEKPVKGKVQFSLIFFCKGEAKPVVTELKKNPVGRPSAHMLAVREADQMQNWRAR